MKSGGQIDGQMSSQLPVVWWYREVNCEVVGMSVEAVPVLDAAWPNNFYRKTLTKNSNL
jgi:hypothetical protein